MGADPAEAAVTASLVVAATPLVGPVALASIALTFRLGREGVVGGAVRLLRFCPAQKASGANRLLCRLKTFFVLAIIGWAERVEGPNRGARGRVRAPTERQAAWSPCDGQGPACGRIP